MQNDETNDTATQINDNDAQSQQQEKENIQQDNQQEVIQQQSLEQQMQSNEALLRQIDDDEPIFILVSNPSEVKSSSMNKYLVYTVKGKDALGNFEVQRRFNEFYTLREALLQIWPGLYTRFIKKFQFIYEKKQIIQYKYINFLEFFNTYHLCQINQQIQQGSNYQREFDY